MKSTVGNSLKKYKIILIFGIVGLVAADLIYFLYNEWNYNMLVTEILYLGLLSFIVFCIDLHKISRKQLGTAILIGVLSISVVVPYAVLGLVAAVTAMLAYLAVQSIEPNDGHRIRLIYSTEKKEILIDAIIIMAAVFIMWIVSNRKIEINGLLFKNLIQAISAGVSEEIIFRYFLYAMIVKCKKIWNSPILTNLIMIVPFVSVHCVEDLVRGNYWEVLHKVIVLSIVAAVLLYAARKRGIVTAVGLHMAWDFVRFGV